MTEIRPGFNKFYCVTEFFAVQDFVKIHELEKNQTI